MTVWLTVLCPDCDADNIIKHGKSLQGKQRYLCRNPECLLWTLVLNTEQPRRQRQVKQKIGDMALNRSGVQDMPDCCMSVQRQSSDAENGF